LIVECLIVTGIFLYPAFELLLSIVPAFAGLLYFYNLIQLFPQRIISHCEIWRGRWDCNLHNST